VQTATRGTAGIDPKRSLNLVKKAHGIVWGYPALRKSSVDVANVHFKLMTIGVKKVERVPLAAIFLPFDYTMFL
jgi:hypothetical protein